MFRDKTCEVLYTIDIKLMSIKMKGKNFSTNMQTDLAYSFRAELGQIWHKRLGHFHYSGLNFMHTNELVQNQPFVKIKDEICGVCQFDK